MVRRTLYLGSKDVPDSLFQDVADWQSILGVRPDGYFGPITEKATKEWQAKAGITPDGVVGPETWETATRLETTQEEIPNMSSLIGFQGVQNLSATERKALVSAANWIGINPDWLASVIKFESNFDPARPNAAGSGAMGLIQFMPSTARNLGTTTTALSKMTFVQQLEYVKKYFAPYRGKLHSLEDTYLVVFYPKAIGQPDDYIVGEAGSAVYEQNAGFDRDDKGYITKHDITSTIRSVYNSGINLPRIAVPLLTLWAVFGTGAIGYTLYKLFGKG